jgi:hypothetical protein
MQMPCGLFYSAWQFFGLWNCSEMVLACGAPEEIRTPDPPEGAAISASAKRPISADRRSIDRKVRPRWRPNPLVRSPRSPLSHRLPRELMRVSRRSILQVKD